MLSLAWLFVGGVRAESPIPTTRADSAGIQRVVDDLRTRLALPRQVVVSIVPVNVLLVSVEAPKDGEGAFALSFEDAFLGALSEDELRAVVAHELGHVWIFTHHPYLQTEQLANSVAMRVVSREVLEEVYGKVWKRQGRKGDLASFLGKPPSSVHPRGVR